MSALRRGRQRTHYCPDEVSSGYCREYPVPLPTGPVHFAQDLHEVGEGAEGKSKGYAGIIYTDGNDIGSHIEKSQTPVEFCTLSHELLRATRLATFKALAQRSLLKPVKCSDGRKRWIHPFEIVAIGGGDVFLIVPGDVALDIALSICEEFEGQFNGKLTMSAGVLIMRE
jgi:CRISPR-associated protein Cmr2